MAGVVIIHALEDGAPAHALAEKLDALGYQASTDLFPHGGVLRERVEEADVVVALWSPRSTARPDLVGEAAYARGLGRLVHARMHNTPAPREFANDPQIDLTGWKGNDDFPGWLNLQAALEGVMSAAYEPQRARRQPAPAPPPRVVDFGEPLAPPSQTYPSYPSSSYASAPRYDPPPPPRSESWRFERAYEPPRYEPPRYNQPSPSGGGSSAARLAVIGLLSFVVVAGVGFGAYQLVQGGRSNSAAESTWATLDKSDPVALRAFINGQPGRYRNPAESALEELELAELNRAREADTVEAYRHFLAGFPDTRHSAEINGRIAMLRQSEAERELMVDEPPMISDTPSLTEPPGGAIEAPQDAPPPADLGGPVPLTPRGANPGNETSADDEIRRALAGE
jgi:hypothetical protein